MKKKQILTLTLATVCVFGLVGCNSKKVEDTPNDTKQEIQETQPDVTPEATPETTEPTVDEVETVVIKPMDEATNLEELQDSILPVSFGKEDFVKNEDGTISINVMVHVYDIYDMTHIASLEVGNAILVGGEEVVVETIEQDEIGAILINGGIDNDGITLVTDEDTVYYVFDYNDAKVYHKLGEILLPVSENFVFYDKVDLENQEATFTAEDLLKEEFEFYFTPINTTIRIENGEVVEMTRIFTP